MSLQARRLRRLGISLIVIAALVLFISAQFQWKTPYYGILVIGHRTDLVLLVVGLLFLGFSLLAASTTQHRKGVQILSGFLLTLSVAAFGLTFVEWYLRHPARAVLFVPDKVLAIEYRHAEPGVGFIARPGPKRRIWEVPQCNVFWTRQDPRIVAQERRKVEVFIDENGFPNRNVPDGASIITLGDSFTMGTDVAWEERWVYHVEQVTGLSIYNISAGGFCPSQVLRLYERYGGVEGVSLVLLGVYGINDLNGEENYQRFLDSGMTVKEWAYHKAHRLMPVRTFGFIQLFRYCTWKHRNKQLPGTAAPSEELDPVTVTNTREPTELSYYPNYPERAYQCATADLATYPAATRLVSSLARLDSICRSQHRQLAVLYFPIKQTIHPPSPDNQKEWLDFLMYALPAARPENWSRERVAEFGRVLLTGDERFAAHLSNVCGSFGVPFYSLIPALQNSVEETGELHYFHFDTHWNAHGHACAGKSIDGWLMRLDLENGKSASPRRMR